jgi:hypothetical protein
MGTDANIPCLEDFKGQLNEYLLNFITYFQLVKSLPGKSAAIPPWPDQKLRKFRGTAPISACRLLTQRF